MPHHSVVPPRQPQELSITRVTGDRLAPSKAIFEELNREDGPPNVARVRKAMLLDIERSIMEAHTTGDYKSAHKLALIRREQWAMLATPAAEVSPEDGEGWAKLLGGVEVVDAPPPGRAEINRLIEEATGEPWKPPPKPKTNNTAERNEQARQMLADGQSSARVAKKLHMTPGAVERLRGTA